MKKFMMLAALVALVVSALAIPAMAEDDVFGGSNQDRLFISEEREDLFEERQDRRQDRFEERGFFFFGEDFEEDDFFFGENGFDDNDFDNGVDQSFEQEAESGEVNQSFNVSSTGDNSNQCVGITGNANTGNVQNSTAILQYASEADDFEFDDSGASLSFGGSSTTTCDQQVNQAAAAG